MKGNGACVAAHHRQIADTDGLDNNASIASSLTIPRRLTIRLY